MQVLSRLVGEDEGAANHLVVKRPDCSIGHHVLGRGKVRRIIMPLDLHEASHQMILQGE